MNDQVVNSLKSSEAVEFNNEIKLVLYGRADLRGVSIFKEVDLPLERIFYSQEAFDDLWYLTHKVAGQTWLGTWYLVVFQANIQPPDRIILVIERKIGHVAKVFPNLVGCLSHYVPDKPYNGRCLNC